MPATEKPATDWGKDLLKGKRALVTGASSGIGEQAAKVLAAHGAHVALAARRTEELERVGNEIAAAGGTATPVQLDVADTESIAQATQTTVDALGGIDVLINNAGVSIQKWALKYTPEEYDFMHGVNQRGAFFMAQAAAQRMAAQGTGGKIVNIASMAVLRTLGQLSIYSMTKVALVQMTKSFALELARYDIQVNCIAPGYIDTPINHEYWKSDMGQRLIERLPNKRVGQPQDLDGAMLLLASPQSDFMTGNVLTVEDGQHFMGG
jgi:NAD(P)-dependent dehydrogenase (short-subunit alcohol dehydrogenase family)